MKRTSMRGMSLIDAVVGSALVLVIFLALIGVIRSSLLIASLAKAKAGATAVADNQMEYVRATPYDTVGTVGGIPAGEIPQYATTTQNSIQYGVRTFIEYVDDPADGLAGSDSNAITTDYKRIKVAITYTVRGTLREVDLISNYAPPSIETATNGGTLKVAVVNALGSPVPGATVRVVNTGSSPTVDVTTFSDAGGVVLLGGAATSTTYQVFVSKAGYSSAQTYARDTTNQNPTPGYLTVVKNQTTTGTFAIDLLSTLTLRTLFPIVATSTTDSFNNNSKIAGQSNTQLSGGSLILGDNGAGGYETSGAVSSTNITFPYLAGWTSVSLSLVQPGGTNIAVQVLDGSGSLIPDSKIPGNSAGFGGSSIDLSGVSTSTYPTLALRADLTTNDANNTPSINSWTINALTGPTPVPGVGLTFTGGKTIGSTGAGAPIIKTTLATTSGPSAQNSFQLEWDSYSLSVSGYDVLDACYAPPFSLSPATSYSNTLYLGTNSSNMALVTVRDGTGSYVSGATVTVSRTGFSQSVTTSACGTAYFGSLTASSAYTVQISKTGYTTTSNTNVNITGHVFYATSFP